MLSLAAPALAKDKADLDNRLRKLATEFEAMQQQPDQSIPPVTLGKARGILLLDRTKGGIVFGYQGGSGVALIRGANTIEGTNTVEGTNTNSWSAPVFLETNEASFGPQIGGERSFVAVLLMNTNATNFLTEGDFEFGTEARGTAGQHTAGAQGTFGSTLDDVLDVPAPSILLQNRDIMR